ncbi:hypothetical protein GOHSU_57_00110 [Gordonia hirsuta DSM 44140 = NBRC 16056]|uniref:Type VII secretion-associated protein n=1 Tax=Gordonia hirsuta DSM 44140 = NBRC 16056 TaxID=1121927 RepID=L7LFQ3_9ACTN|nr:type VII secretion-associated protein [Gordonia hirsuta]GAC58893.1 hypothetical protein GOHSU_57_00110 [Gordonia hirsuta DSM 44140 = NBRC 16056]
MTVVDLADAELLRVIDEPDAVARLAAGLSAAGYAPATGAVGCPSTWGGPRRERLSRALAQVGAPVHLISRSQLIAASHADALTRSCAVIETLLVPGERPGQGPPAVSGQLLTRTAGRWQVEAGAAAELFDPATAPSGLLELAGRAEVIFVDCPAAPGLAGALTEAFPDLPVVTVDRALVRRHGGRALPVDDDFGFRPPPLSRQRRGRRAAVLAAVATLVVLAALGGVMRWSRAIPPDAAGIAAVGPVELLIPADWRRTELSGTDPGDGRGLRAVFADGGDGRRVIVVVTALRAGTDAAAVARSLRNRIAQRGDQVVVEFAATARYGGREVISYREAPVSGAAVRWYVVVVDHTQVSLGCQSGDGGAEIEAVCARAVASVQISAT